MKIKELKEQIGKYQYFEDTKVIDICLASIISTRLKLGDPVWLVIIGASSGGKSQLLRPLALTDDKFIHRIDDLTENTFLSGMKAKGGSPSLLHRIGEHGMIAISDLTVLFSKPAESRATILSQFRMLYDGEMIKHSGSQDKPLIWKGYLGVIAGSTPSLYSKFEEVADMGERFIYYRMKEFDPIKATELALSRTKFGKELDTELANYYQEYVKDVVVNSEGKTVVLSDTTQKRIIEVSAFAERVRTAVHIDNYTKHITRIPTSAMPMRVALQLTTIAKALTLMKSHDDGTNELDSEGLSCIDWVGYSLANEEKRACLRVLANIPFDDKLSTSAIADEIGLHTDIVKIFLQNLASTKILKRSGEGGTLRWSFVKEDEWHIVRRIEGISGTVVIQDREVSYEEEEEFKDQVEEMFKNF